MGDVFQRVKIALLLGGCLLLGIQFSLATAGESAPVKQLQDIQEHVELAMDALKTGDVQVAKKHYHEFDEGWERIEDGVRVKSRDSYRKIEQAMGKVKARLVKPDKPNSKAALSALEQLKAVIDASLSTLR